MGFWFGGEQSLVPAQESTFPVFNVEGDLQQDLIPGQSEPKGPAPKPSPQPKKPRKRHGLLRAGRNAEPSRKELLPSPELGSPVPIPVMGSRMGPLKSPSRIRVPAKLCSMEWEKSPAADPSIPDPRDPRARTARLPFTPTMALPNLSDYLDSLNNYSDYPDYTYEDAGTVWADPAHDPKDITRILSVIIYSVSCVLGILGNGLVIAIITLKMKKSVNAVWFLNLAVADFLFNIFLPINIAYTAMSYHWIFGTVMCKLNSFLLILNMYTSVLLLTTISFDRYVSVVFPVWSQNHRSTNLAYGVCVIIWTLGIVMSCPSLVFRDTAQTRNSVICFSNFSLSRNKSYEGLALMRHRTVNITRFLAGYILPITIITFCYIAIVFNLRRNRLAKSKKPFKIIVTIIVTFFLCWSPYHLLNLLETVPNAVPWSVFEIFIPLTTALAASNSCMNPVLYVFMGQDFKKFKVTLLSRLVNALSEETGHSSIVHRSFSKISSMTEKETTVV
ncbi:chemerin-like receptor 1 isoform X2 [Poecile atricapillus]|uniref:chemerin-like receptor 1 isoform X2 n=1 Tax=Poecile atricapillus TaxID=48891 RepID=UPI00273830F9|nr:chemerin-like receptor 1 isoform X2 [Poecile atricapillus]